MTTPPLLRLRIDKWLWAARFYKTRSLASDEISLGRVQVNQRLVKASYEVRIGDQISLRQGDYSRTVEVKGVSATRGPAPVAQHLYEESQENLALRMAQMEQRRLHREPAHSIEGGRPTKRDRRQIDHQWNNRWSASLD